MSRILEPEPRDSTWKTRVVILICYDDSADAKAAVERGAELLRGQPATVVTAWQPFGADAILMGSRGLTGLKSLLIGSVSQRVIQHADRPVIVVPPREVATSCARGRYEIDGSG